MAVADAAGLRPSADRTRETVFNWLGPQLPGAHCLDLFAGTGVFAFEAVSRGAAAALAVERDVHAVAAMQALRKRLDAGAVEIIAAEVGAWLERTPARAFDVVFIDPPFAADTLAPTLARLERGWLSPAARVYVESARGAFSAPPPWQLLKHGNSRDADYQLLSRAP